MNRLSFLLLLLLGTMGPLAAAEPTVFVCGIWPDRILFFDQATETFSEGPRLRHGAVLEANYTQDRRLVFLVTDGLERVEVLDTTRREVVDEFKLSTPDRLIRIFAVFPNREGTRVYVSASVVRRQSDRFEREEVDFLRYDLEKRQVIDSFRLPEEVGLGEPELYVSPDESSFFVLGNEDILEIDAKDHTVKDRIRLSKPLLAGYGPVRDFTPTQIEPGVFYGFYHTTDPVQEKELFGVAKLDLNRKKVENFELGPTLRMRRFVLSPDGKRGYAGPGDMVVVDMEKRRVLLRKEGFERGRSNNSMIVSSDGRKLYVSGVGDTMYIYDAATLERLGTIDAGGDFMLPPIEIPNLKD